MVGQWARLILEQSNHLALGRGLLNLNCSTDGLPNVHILRKLP